MFMITAGLTCKAALQQKSSWAPDKCMLILWPDLTIAARINIMCLEIEKM